MLRRQVECQFKETRNTLGLGVTPEWREDGFTSVGGTLVAKPEQVAAETTKTEVYLLFYDQHDTAHRNAIPLILTEQEAESYEIGKFYTLEIS